MSEVNHPRRKPGVTAIIVNYNSAKNLKVVSEAVQAAIDLDYSPLEIVIVDNGSTDGTDKALQSLLSEHTCKGVNVKFVKLEKNVGFGAANNIGYARRDPSSRYVALINSDLAPAPRSVTALVEYMEKHPEAGGVQGRILTWDGKRIDNAGFYLSRSWFSFPRGVMKAACTKYPEASVSYLDGAYSLYSVAAIRKIGTFFLEEFFLYGDDYEIGSRLWRSGLALRYCDVIAGRHYRGATTEGIERSLAYFQWQGLVGTIVVHDPYWFIVLPLRLPFIFRSTTTYAKFAMKGALSGISLGLKLRRKFGMIGGNCGPRLSYILLLKLWALLLKMKIVGQDKEVSSARGGILLQHSLARLLEEIEGTDLF
jgi:GT2 family glycosyltransferase